MDASQRQGELVSVRYNIKLTMVEQDVVSRLAELDMVAADLTRANERVAAVERRNVCFHSPSRTRLTNRKCYVARSSPSRAVQARQIGSNSSKPRLASSRLKLLDYFEPLTKSKRPRRKVNEL